MAYRYKELFEQLFESMMLPVVVGSFDDDEVPKYPFIEYHRGGRDYFNADDVVYQKTDIWEINIYSKKKDFERHWDLVDNLEDLLDNYRVDYSVSADNFFDDVITTTFDLALLR